MECTVLRSRFDANKSNRSNIEGTFELIEQFVVPYRGAFFSDSMSELEVNWRKRSIFDSTAIIACQALAPCWSDQPQYPVV